MRAFRGGVKCARCPAAWYQDSADSNHCKECGLCPLGHYRASCGQNAGECAKNDFEALALHSNTNTLAKTGWTLASAGWCKREHVLEVGMRCTKRLHTKPSTVRPAGDPSVCQAYVHKKCEGRPCVDLRRGNTTDHFLMWLESPGSATVKHYIEKNGTQGPELVSAAVDRRWVCNCSARLGLVGEWSCPASFVWGNITISAHRTAAFSYHNSAANAAPVDLDMCIEGNDLYDSAAHQPFTDTRTPAHS